MAHSRYRNHIKMRNESRHYEMSYLEKRRNDRRLGKFYKSVLKHKQNRR